MRRVTGLVLALVAVAGCGNSGIQGTLVWRTPPTVRAQAGRSPGIVEGIVRNTTSHGVRIDPRQMRLLDADGHKVKATIRIGRPQLPPGGAAALGATWSAGKPVRIDYGAGTLALTSR